MFKSREVNGVLPLFTYLKQEKNSLETMQLVLEDTNYINQFVSFNAEEVQRFCAKVMITIKLMIVLATVGDYPIR